MEYGSGNLLEGFTGATPLSSQPIFSIKEVDFVYAGFSGFSFLVPLEVGKIDVSAGVF